MIMDKDHLLVGKVQKKKKKELWEPEDNRVLESPLCFVPSLYLLVFKSKLTLQGLLI